MTWRVDVGVAPQMIQWLQYDESDRWAVIEMVLGNGRLRSDHCTTNWPVWCPKNWVVS